eukprot:m.468708 g.468708  ORF g.468708 m.468708 type:complete len:59 (-) comp27773_c0_seq1:40-216(-)
MEWNVVISLSGWGDNTCAFSFVASQSRSVSLSTNIRRLCERHVSLGLGTLNVSWLKNC